MRGGDQWGLEVISPASGDPLTPNRTMDATSPNASSPPDGGGTTRTEPVVPSSSPSGEFYELSDLENCDLTSLNAKTLQGLGDLEVEEDEEDHDGKQIGGMSSILAYFVSGAGATFLILMALASILGIAGGIGHAMRLQRPVVLGSMTAWSLCLLGAALLMALAVIRVSLNLLFRGIGLLFAWNWVHHAKALEAHFTALLWLTGCLICTINFTDEPDLVKTIVAFLFMIICLAVKSHYMRGLAMSFNYENYRDRIETALRTDHVLELLWRSRHTYKFRKRVTFGRNFWRGGTRSNEAASPKPSLTPEMTPQGTVRSFNAAVQQQSPLNSAQQPQTQQPTHQQQASSASKKSVGLTEAEKKANFVAFSRLAAKAMGAVSSGSAADFRAENSRESRKQASKLFKYLRNDERGYLLPNDLRAFIEDEADWAFCIALLKKNIKWQNAAQGSDDFVFGERALRKLIQSHLNELVAIMKSMQSIEMALDKVDSIFSLVIVLVVGLCGAILFGNAAQLLLAMGTFLSGAAFIFSTAARNAFESLVFLLLVHPFDVGDRVFIALGSQILPTGATIPATMSGSDALDNLVVVEMHLLSTVFERWDGVRLYVPNYILATKPVFNIRRSGPLVELQRIQISFDTPLAKIDELRERLDKFVRADRTDFTDLSRVNFDTVESCNRIHMNVIAQYNGNWQDIDKQLAFRTRFIMFIKAQLEDLGISYLPPVQRVAIVDQRGKPIEYNGNN